MPKLRGSQSSGETAFSLPPRLTAAELAELLRLTPRGIQAAAAAGRLPGAARIGKLWTFDRAKIERFIAEREAQCANGISIKGVKRGGCAPLWTELKSAKAYEQAISDTLAFCAAKSSKRSSGGKRPALGHGRTR